MPYKDPQAARLASRERVRRYRKRQSIAKKLGPSAVEVAGDPADVLAAWSAATLVVPAGHPNAGQAMTLPPYGVEFLRDALAPGVRESLLTMGRKNAKSAIVAVLTLGLLAGPLRRPGLRIGTVSVTREKAGELLTQCRDIAEASELAGLEFMRTPSPGMVRGADGTTADFLSADKSSGHASGFDLAIIDELGLMTERDRELVAGMRTSTSARDGRLLAISVRGECPMLEELLQRADLATCAVHMYAPETPLAGDVDVSDPSVWAAANPGLELGIKSAAWMADEAARVLQTPSDLSSFLALDLNLPQTPGREMIFAPEDLTGCFVPDPPERAGPCYVGFDFGGAAALSAAFAIWPQTGRCEAWAACGDVPDLVSRGRRDGARYDLMVERGELRTYPGRVTPVAAFLADVASDLAGCRVKGSASDAWKSAEARDFMDQAGLRWPHTYRRSGTGKEGSQDVRALQRLVLNRRLRMRESLALAACVRNSAIRRDGNGNPALDRESGTRHIDLLSAAVIAAGLSEAEFDRAARPGVYLGAV